MKQIVLVVILCICISTVSFADGGVVGVEPGLDAQGNTIPEELNDFKYEIIGDRIYIHDYDGDDRIITINGSYDIDGKTYQTDLSEFEASISDDVEGVIFGEGIKEIAHTTFNFSDVQKVYFPLSMEKVEDDSLSYLHTEGDNEYIQIYYEGTQEEWAKIFRKYESMTMEKADNAEDYGTAAADWLNNLLGAGYDSSEFEYFFSATPEDLLSSMGE